MKLKLALIPIVVAVGFPAYVALHPGVAYAEPRMASGALAPFAADLANYTIDPAHTSLYFEIRHLGLSVVHGRINDFSGKVVEDEKDLTKSSIELTAKITSIDTACPPRDTDLRGKDFFDADKYPNLTFKSTKIVKKGNGYVLTGDLTIKGVTKSIEIPFKHYGPLSMKSIPGQPDRIGVVAEPIVIKRLDFGIGNDFKLPDGTEGASNEVTLRISMEATLDK